jgi:hypothetical protein
MTSKKNLEFFISLNKLPEFIVLTIYDYIPRKYLVFTNKENYELYHYYLKSSINNYENYIRTMVRKECDFVFKIIIYENLKIWKNLKQYQYKGIIYKNYLYFILNYCIDNESTKCKELARKLISQEGMSKNQHKKNICKYINGKTKHK